MIAKVFMWHWSDSHVTVMWYSCESCDRLYCGLAYIILSLTNCTHIPQCSVCQWAGHVLTPVVGLWWLSELSFPIQGSQGQLSCPYWHTLCFQVHQQLLEWVEGMSLQIEESSNSWRMLSTCVECAYNGQWIESHSLILCRAKTHRLRKWGNTCNEVPPIDSPIPRSCGLGMRLTTKLQLQNMEDELFTKYLSCALCWRLCWCKST